MTLADQYPEIQAVLDGESEGCIVCADCLEIMPLLPDKAIDFVFTDPPYGHNNNNGDLIARREAVFGGDKTRAKDRPISNDGTEADVVFQIVLQFV